MAAESRPTENVVVIPDIHEGEMISSDSQHSAEDPNSAADGTSTVLATTIKTRLTNDPHSVITVPVSVPVGTIISGTTFNVITADQLTDFKPMICVDNGFISATPVTEEIKATYNPIPPSANRLSSSNNANTMNAYNRSVNSKSWVEVANMPVLPIRCKNTSAELHKNMFGSGGRGKCIKYGSKWYTPNKFEALCGRGSSKDWRRSIKFGGRSIQVLIDDGILKPHATGCTCGACCDDHTAKGPVRLYTPYKRKKRTQNNDVKKVKTEKVATNENINNSNNNSNSKEAWQALAEGIDQTDDYALLDNNEPTVETSSGLHEINLVLKRLEDISQTLLRVSGELNNCIEEVKVLSSRQVEKLEQERANSMLNTSIDGKHVSLHTVEDSEHKKCANCNREASAECSLCRRTPYCSTYCQKKDWSSHQIECLRTVPLHDTQQQSIMFIVEGQHH